MTNDDADKIDEICAIFIKALISNKLDDERSYIELVKRLSNLVEMEVKWKFDVEERKILMAAWGPLVN